MRYLKPYKKFQENAAASASSSAGMGAVSAAQPGALAGTPGTEGSGDLGFTFKKEKRKKGDPTRVSDMRDLAPAKGITFLKESDLISRDPQQDSGTRETINNCLVELYDLDFELGLMAYNKQRNSVDSDEEGTRYYNQEELRISLSKTINEIWTGNMIIICVFNESGVISKDVMTLRASGKSLSQSEEELLYSVEEIAQKLIGNLDYSAGSFKIQWQVAGSAMPYNSERNISVNVQFSLENNLEQ